VEGGPNFWRKTRGRASFGKILTGFWPAGWKRGRGGGATMSKKGGGRKLQGRIDLVKVGSLDQGEKRRERKGLV